MNRFRTSHRDERGAAAILVAVTTCFVLFIVAALTVDIGNTWARRGSLQSQADHAAKLAAEMLPVDATTVPATPTASQLKVAKTAAYYIACHRVPGQKDLSVIPACPTASTYLTDTGIDTFAKAMLANGKTLTPSHIGTVSFPTVNRVKVTAPSSRIEYGFANVAGVDESIQSKSATAVVLSPGDLLPVGMSATCIANAVGQAPLGVGDYISKVIPINYLSTGAPVSIGAQVTSVPLTPGLTDWSGLAGASPANSATISLDLTTSISPSGAVTLYFDWTSGKTGWNYHSIKIYVLKVGAVYPEGLYQSPEIPIPLLQQSNPSGEVTFSLGLPPGDYEAMVKVTGKNSGLGGEVKSWFNNPNQNAAFNVPESTVLRELVSCARPAQSPRLGLSSPTGDADAMGLNFSQGLDHGLAMFPGLGNALDGLHLPSTTLPSSVSGLVGTVTSLFQCDTNSRVKKDYPTRRVDGANCFYVDTTQDWSVAVTKGLLTGGTSAVGAYDGRLKCPASGACNFSSARSVLTNPGGITGTYNNDHFSDFLKSGSLLNDPFFMALDSFLSPSLPLITPPNDVVDDAVYDSPRFFWAPISLSAFNTVAPGAKGDHPILAFRPVFLTSDSSTSTVASTIDTFLFDLVRVAQLKGYTLQATLQNFADSVLNLSPCAGVLSVLTLLTSILLGPSQLDACELALLKTPLFGSKATNATVGGFIEKFLGSNIVTKDAANSETFGGLIIDKSAAKVRAARIMTIAPGALPAVPQDYAGPTTDYLGTGPKIIRLVK